MLVNKQLMVAIDFRSMEKKTMEVNGYINCLPTFFKKYFVELEGE